MAGVVTVAQVTVDHTWMVVGAGIGIGPISASSLSDLFKQWTGQLADWVELVAAIIIALAVVEATVQAVRLFWDLARGRHLEPAAKEALRLRLGRWLAVGLEFELAADILRTAIAPTWNEIGLLAAVATIRTALNYFLEQEIERGARLEQTRVSARAPGDDGAARMRQPSPLATDSEKERADDRRPAPA